MELGSSHGLTVGSIKETGKTVSNMERAITLIKWEPKEKVIGKRVKS